MKRHIKTLVIIVLVATLLAFVSTVESKTEYIIEEVTNTVTVYETKELSPAQVIWLAKLMNCESGIKTTAINPNDLDNTPSYGLLQFKPSTFSAFTAKYDIESDDYMDANAQVEIVMHWILNPGEVRWEGQFPACVKKLGLPPQ